MLGIVTAAPNALLINPPVYDFALYDLFLQPYGLMRIGSWLARCGWNVEYVNCLDYSDPESSRVMGQPKRRPDGTGKFYRNVAAKPDSLKSINRRYARYGILEEAVRERLRKAAEGGAPEAVFITTGMTYWYPGVAEAVEAVRGLFPRVPVFAGGVYATLMPEHLRARADVDYVVPGEALSGTFLPSILQRLGLPACAETRIYPDDGIAAALCPAASVLELNRGCPFSCTYCASKKLCPSFRPGDPEAAFAYFSELYRRGVRNFAFYDDALLYRKEDVLFPFLREVIGGGFNARFYTPNAVHLRYIDEETALLMKRAGFCEVRLGFESADEGFHTSYDSKFDVGSFAGRIGALKDAGFRPEQLRVYILAGLPGQRAEEVEESVRYAHKAGVRVMLARYSPVPGTALWPVSVQKSRYPIEEEPLYHNNTFFSMEWDGFTRSDLQRMQDLTVELNRNIN
jgi:hypothetical protein